MTTLFDLQRWGAPPHLGEWAIWYGHKGSRVASYKPHACGYVLHLSTSGIRVVRTYVFSLIIILAEA